ncbi:MAG: helix-turn-helix domain-containing protein [Sporosarcina sp.]
MKTYLSNYAHFTNKQDLDAATRQHVLTHWNEMNQTERAVLDMIRRYSVKCGAAHLKHETFEKAIQKSNATVRRAIRKLEKLEIIERIQYIRPVMSGLGANIYVIQPTNDQTKLNTPKNDEKPTARRAEPVKLQTEAFLSSAIGESKLARIFYGVYRKLPGYYSDVLRKLLARLSWIMTCHLRGFSIISRNVRDGQKWVYKTNEQWKNEGSHFGMSMRLKARFVDWKIAAMSGGATCAINDRKISPRGSADCPLYRRQIAPSNNLRV